MVDTTRGSLA